MGVKQSAVHQLAIPGEDSKHFCPMHLGIRVVEDNTVLSGTGYNNVKLTKSRKRARSASAVGVGPLWPACLSLELMKRSWPLQTPLTLQWKEPCPRPSRGRCNPSRGWTGVSSCPCIKQRQKSVCCPWNKERYSHTRWRAWHRLCGLFVSRWGTVPGLRPTFVLGLKDWAWDHLSQQ